MLFHCFSNDGTSVCALSKQTNKLYFLILISEANGVRQKKRPQDTAAVRCTSYEPAINANEYGMLYKQTLKRYTCNANSRS